MPDPGSLSEQELLDLVREQRWFGARDRGAEGAFVAAVPVEDGPLAVAVIEVRLGSGAHEHYAVVLDRSSDLVVDALEQPELACRLAALAGLDAACESVRPMVVEQSNSSVVIDERHVLKLYRRLEAGPNPEAELLEALRVAGYDNAPRLEGVLETGGAPVDTTLATVTGLVDSAGGGWELTLASLERDPEWLPRRAARLGEVIALLHGALVSATDDTSLAPEEPSAEALPLLAAELDDALASVLSEAGPESEVAAIAHRVDEFRDLARDLAGSGPSGLAIRTHGDLHLGQVLWTRAGDWVVIDFEGEPGRPLPERRRRRPALRDVAGMTRSFAYAADVAELTLGQGVPPGWVTACRSAFLDSYRATVDPRLVPPTERGVERLLALFELEKLLYEVRYEMRSRPEWAAIPVRALVRLLEDAG